MNNVAIINMEHIFISDMYERFCIYLRSQETYKNHLDHFGKHKFFQEFQNEKCDILQSICLSGSKLLTN